MSETCLRLPKVGHIGLVVAKVERVVEYYQVVFGIGPFDIYDFEPKRAWLHGQEVKPFKLKIGAADLGPTILELIEVVEGNPPHRAHLEFRGEGLQHLGFYVENYDEWKAYVIRQGIEILCEADIEDSVRGRRRAFYMETSHIGGVLFEIIERKKTA
jgi:methylmalonyl-CoA/ethylmalonyl-CoA epimerase